MENKFYRVTCDGIGIYEAVDKYCKKEDERRKNKPDGSWLPKVGVDFPGKVSFWTEKGFKKYQESGLFDWHKSVVEGEIKIIEINHKPENILYEDDYQIIFEYQRQTILETSKFTFLDFLEVEDSSELILANPKDLLSMKEDENTIYKLPIILIGPISAGKSSVANVLSQKLNIPITPVDWIRYYYYFKSGLDLDKMEIMKKENFSDWFDFMRPYELDCVKSILSDEFMQNSVIELGAGHSYYSEKSQMEDFKKILSDYKNVFYLIPSSDNNVSLEILKERINRELSESDIDAEKVEVIMNVNKKIIESKLNEQVAKKVIYTNQKSIEEIAEEIIKNLK